MAKKKKKKVISKQEKSLRNRIYRLKSKNKKEVEKLSLFKNDVFYSLNSLKVSENFKGINFKQTKKVKGQTLINIIRNKIKDNNNDYTKTFKTLENKFKKKLKVKQKYEKSKTGFRTSPEFFAWELNAAIGWIESKIKNDPNIVNYILKTDEKLLTLNNYEQIQITYDLKNKLFRVFIVELDEDNQ